METTDLPLSAFLQVRNHSITEVHTESGRGKFVFLDTPELHQDVLRWGNNEAVEIKVRDFVNAMRNLKGMVTNY